MSQTSTILRRPLITEKSTRLREENIYVLEVHPEATKGQIRQEVESRFKVNVLAVRTSSMPGKFRRRGGPAGGYTSDWKKAIVSVKEGQQIKWEEVA